MSALLYVAKTRLMVTLTYRFEVLSSMLTSFFLLIASVFLWKTVYRTATAVGGVGLEQMVTYTILSTLLGILFTFQTEHIVQGRIREGDIAVDFLKPVSTFALYFAEDFGGCVSAFLRQMLPLLLFSALFIQVPAPATIPHLLLFLASAAMSYLLLWLFSALVGLSGFWLVDLGPVGYVKDVLLRFLSGSIIPIWFFPDWARSIMACLPFIYTWQLPLGIFIGKFTLTEALGQMLIQAGWVLGLFFVFRFLEHKARRRLAVQGG